jgi:hypothetical protein
LQRERRDERKKLKTPSPLPSPALGRGEKEDEKILTAPLTLSLSRWWRDGTCKSRVRDRGILKLA